MSEVVVQPSDYRFISNDSNFNAARNKAIIAETIKETDKFLTEIDQLKMDDNLGNRIDVLSSYADYRFNRGTKKFEDYVGRELYKSLIGEKILSKVRVMDTVNRLNGNNKYKKSILL